MACAPSASLGVLRTLASGNAVKREPRHLFRNVADAGLIFPVGLWIEPYDDPVQYSQNSLGGEMAVDDGEGMPTFLWVTPWQIVGGHVAFSASVRIGGPNITARSDAGIEGRHHDLRRSRPKRHDRLASR